MGEVAKRCKNQWMPWTEGGLASLLQQLLTKYANPDYYEAFTDTILYQATKTTMRCDVSVEATRGTL